MAFWSYAALSFVPSSDYNLKGDDAFPVTVHALFCSKVQSKHVLISQFLNIADCILEENQPNFSVLSSQKANPPILFFHIVLHHSSFDNVCPRSRASYLGYLLHSCILVLLEHSSCPKILSLHCSLPPL